MSNVGVCVDGYAWSAERRYAPTIRHSLTSTVDIIYTIAIHVLYIVDCGTYA